MLRALEFPFILHFFPLLNKRKKNVFTLWYFTVKSFQKKQQKKSLHHFPQTKTIQQI